MVARLLCRLEGHQGKEETGASWQLGAVQLPAKGVTGASYVSRKAQLRVKAGMAEW